MNLQTKVYETPQVIHEGNISVRAGTTPNPRQDVQPLDLFSDD